MNYEELANSQFSRVRVQVRIHGIALNADPLAASTGPRQYNLDADPLAFTLKSRAGTDPR